MVRYIRQSDVFKAVQEYRLWIWVYSFCGIAILILFAFSTYKFIHQPLLKLVKSFKRVESGDLNIFIRHHRRDEFHYLFEKFNEMIRNVNTLIDQVYRQKILAQKAELKQLQSQINPHFLYNSLFILNMMAKTGDRDTLERFTLQLGEYFRFITKNNSDEVTLLEEIQHARIYSEIQETRLSNRIDVQFGSLPEQLNDVIVPRLILQPVIENAFIHGLESSEDGGSIQVSIEYSSEQIWISVEDTGNTLADYDLERLRNILSGSLEAGEMVGLLNIHRRLQLKFGSSSGLKLERGKDGGLKVILCMIIQEGIIT